MEEEKREPTGGCRCRMLRVYKTRGGAVAQKGGGGSVQSFTVPSIIPLPPYTFGDGGALVSNGTFVHEGGGGAMD